MLRRRGQDDAGLNASPLVLDLRNRVTVFYEEIAGELGVSQIDVREALIELKDDGFFPGKPSLATEQFHGRLPA